MCMGFPIFDLFPRRKIEQNIGIFSKNEVKLTDFISFIFVGGMRI